MIADIGPHVYKPLPTPKAQCAECLGTERSDFCRDEGVALAHRRITGRGVDVVDTSSLDIDPPARHVTAAGPGLYASHSRSMCGPECDERAVR